MSVSRTAPIRRGLGGIASDPLLRNSFYLLATTVIMAAAGFAFWVVSARLFPVHEVGLATVLITGVTLLSHMSLVGMNSTVVRHLNGAQDQDDVASSAISTVVLAAVVFGVGYLALLPVTAPDLAEVARSPGTALLFVAMTVGSAVNLITDYICIARRAAGWNFLLDGLLLGIAKLALPYALVWAGLFGVFSASAGAATMAGVASVLVCRLALGIRLRPSLSSRLLRETWSYSAVNYAANFLNLLPVLAMPLVLLRVAGPAVTAGFFVAFQVATILNSIPYAVCESMFAEASAVGAGRLRSTALRAGTIIVAVTLPAVALVLLVADLVLGFFSPEYRESAHPALTVLAVATVAVALYSWANYLLKLTGQLVGIVVVNLVYAASIVALVIAWADRGVTWVATAWGVGNLLAGFVGIAFLARRKR